jgi:hypothetical protein
MAMQLSRHMTLGFLISVGAVILGCASGPTTAATSICGSDYACLKQATSRYRQQAMQLSALAERYEIDAAAKAQELGQDAEQVKRQRELAKQYWSEAQQADELAQQFRRQLPHNMVY